MSTFPDESVRVRWRGELRNGHGSEDVVLGTTDRCIVFRSETGRHGTFPRDHVSTIESEVRTETEYEGLDYRLLVGGGALLSTLSFLGAILAGSGAAALFFVLLGVGGLRLADFGWKHREEYDGIERVENEVERITVHTDSGARRQFVLPVEEGVGARLSEFVRTGERPEVPNVEDGVTPAPGATDPDPAT
ncbi:hypothetical protein BRC81_01300 [Halobacteriales archaeon QS_1_68_20]|nr:MAG: hypothetical protein BRC81_01300 [Halobacteriales archaeon QS_1_68_20]